MLCCISVWQVLQDACSPKLPRVSTTMGHPLSAPWGVHITADDFEKLKGGFKPRQMEDKWECTADQPDAQGCIVIRWTQSWVDIETIALRIKGLSDGAEIVDIMWERDTGAPGAPRRNEVEAKELATMLCQGVLGCEWGKPYVPQGVNA